MQMTPVRGRPDKEIPPMTHNLPPLPYSFDALEPYIDAKTMEIHRTGTTGVTSPISISLSKAIPTLKNFR